MQQPRRLRHVVDIDGGSGDVLVRGIVPLVGRHAALDVGGLQVGRGVLVHQAASCRVTVTGAFVPLVSAKNRLSRFFAANWRYAAVARMSVSGVKSMS